MKPDTLTQTDSRTLVENLGNQQPHQQVITLESLSDDQQLDVLTHLTEQAMKAGQDFDLNTFIEQVNTHSEADSAHYLLEAGLLETVRLVVQNGEHGPWGNSHLTLLQYLTDEGHIQPNAQILHIGVGADATLMRRALAAHPNLHMTGVEINPKNTESANNLLTAQFPGRAEVIHAGAAKYLGSDTNPHDAIVMQCFGQHIPIPQLDAMLAIVSDRLNPGGILIFSDLKVGPGESGWHTLPPTDPTIDIAQATNFIQTAQRIGWSGKHAWRNTRHMADVVTHATSGLSIIEVREDDPLIVPEDKTALTITKAIFPTIALGMTNAALAGRIPTQAMPDVSQGIQFFYIQGQRYIDFLQNSGVRTQIPGLAHVVLQKS